jgi:glucose-6-phosphate isomerase
MVFGWNLVEEFLNGANDLDRHTVETNPRHNLPVLMALTDVWNEIFFGPVGRVVAPWTEAFAAYPAFCASLESQTCGIASELSNEFSAVVIDGGLHNSYDRVLYQSRIVPSEIVMAMDTQIVANGTESVCGKEDVYQTQDALICSFFAHADELAFGASEYKLCNQLSEIHDSEHRDHSSATVAVDKDYDEEESEGNRPSMLVMCGKCDAFTCGQLVAAAEHRAVIKAHIWGIDPFSQGVGSSIREKRAGTLREELEKMLSQDGDLFDDGHGGDGDRTEQNESQTINISTKTMLGHYAGTRLKVQQNKGA